MRLLSGYMINIILGRIAAQRTYAFVDIYLVPREQPSRSRSAKPWSVGCVRRAVVRTRLGADRVGAGSKAICRATTSQRVNIVRLCTFVPGSHVWNGGTVGAAACVVVILSTTAPFAHLPLQVARCNARLFGCSAGFRGIIEVSIVGYVPGKSGHSRSRCRCIDDRPCIDLRRPSASHAGSPSG